MLLKPVMFPPGRARLATRPTPTGSPTATMTMGIELVSCLTARVTCVPGVTMTSTFSRTRLRAISRTRSSRSGEKDRQSTAIFWPILYPPSRSPFSNACPVVVVYVQSTGVKTATRGSRWASDACGREHIPSVIARKIAANLVLITIASFSFVTFCAGTVCSDTETG